MVLWTKNLKGTLKLGNRSGTSRRNRVGNMGDFNHAHISWVSLFLDMNEKPDFLTVPQISQDAHVHIYGRQKYFWTDTGKWHPSEQTLLFTIEAALRNGMFIPDDFSIKRTSSQHFCALFSKVLCKSTNRWENQIVYSDFLVGCKSLVDPEVPWGFCI